MEIEVVASVVDPKTVKGPVDVAPEGLAKKLRFSTHADPVQYNVEPVADPLLRMLGILNQTVDTPFEDNTCPGVPDALVESRSAPLICSELTVVVASVVEPSTVRYP